VVVLPGPPLPNGQNLRDDRLALQVLVLHLLRHLLGDLLLLGRVHKDRRSVLWPVSCSFRPQIGSREGQLTRSPIGPLAVHCRRVVCPVEKLDELAVSHRALLVRELHGLGVACAARADLSIAYEGQLCADHTGTRALTWVGHVSAGVARLSLELRQVRVVLAEQVLGSPLSVSAWTRPRYPARKMAHETSTGKGRVLDLFRSAIDTWPCSPEVLTAFASDSLVPRFDRGRDRRRRWRLGWGHVGR
jgi:hypothetical protein